MKAISITQQKTQRDFMKERRQHGMGYVGRKYNQGGDTYEKEVKPARKMLERCFCHSYHTQCHVISEEERQLVFQEIWSMNDEGRRRYIWTQIDRIRSEREFSRKKQLLFYHLAIGGGRMRVCKKMFLSTTGIRQWWILNTIRQGVEHQEVE
ncbi:hypothetical protein ElyMa_001018400 [Elysia marginata]|uniref:Uncharacterized protein n=1 Tax=Elysia marginata TaxID=1093978 RepID=A0AAV4HP86_9GAST|nr:hypothetical protein ElyMa_001018400 [Elysia marginata]